jgi:hypothetical protein
VAFELKTPEKEKKKMSTTISLKNSFNAYLRWYLFTTCLLLQLTLGARAQEVAQAKFKFVHTPSLLEIGSLAADSENDIWATAVTSPLALHFDGHIWKQVSMANASRINRVAVLSPDNVWAVGQQPSSALSQIQHFDGKKWSVVPSPHFASGETLNSLKALSTTSIFAVGLRRNSRKREIPIVEHFDGTKWSFVSVPHILDSALFDLAVVSASDVWAVGGTANSPLALHFDGNQWSRIAMPGGFSTLFGVTALSSNDVWAVGTQGPIAPFIEHWDGTQWSIIPNPGPAGGGLNTISAISSTDIWAAGCTNGCGDAGGPPLVEHWDGTQWNLNSVPVKTGGEDALSVLTFPSKHVYISGFVFGTSGPTSFVLKGAEAQ